MIGCHSDPISASGGQNISVLRSTCLVMPMKLDRGLWASHLWASFHPSRPLWCQGAGLFIQKCQGKRKGRVRYDAELWVTGRTLVPLIAIGHTCGRRT